MEEKPKETVNFIGYDYQDVSISEELETIYLDSYTNFGWKLEKVVYRPKRSRNVKIKFKRERKIRNKTELTRLQRHFDANLKEILSMRKKVEIHALTVALGVGLMGTGLLAGGVFAFLRDSKRLTILLGILGFLGWLLPYFLYSCIGDKKRKKMTPLIEMKYDEIYEICKKGKSLL